MKKRKIIPWLLPVIAVIIGAILYFHMIQEETGGEPNLLIITMDTTRADHIGFYRNHTNKEETEAENGKGQEEIKTPSIDKLAAEGITFINCYTPVPLTLPAHSSLFTGRYPIAHNVRNNGRYALPNDGEKGDTQTTLARFFKQKGFHNYAVIASYVLLSKFGLGSGYDIYDDSLNSSQRFLYFNSEIPADAVYTKFSKWFASNGEKKFFAWIHFFDPHSPYEPPESYAKESDPLKTRYNGEISYMDTYIGKIMEDLASAGMLDKTIVVIVGDHGEAFGEHTEFGHGIFCYEEVLKVPLIIHNRGMFKKHRLVKNRVSLVDIFPTIVELYGEKVPASVQGKSFKHLLTGKKEADERLIYFESMYGKEENNWAPLTGLIDGSLKYIALPQPELYDLGKDRKEKTNIIGRNPRISRQYDEKLKRFLSLHSFSNNGAKRSLSREDTAHLESLGYISRGAGKSASVIDPKTGVVLDIKLKELNKKISVGQYESSEKELKVLIAADTKLRHPMLYILLDKIYLAQKNRPASLQNLQAGLQLFPNSDELNYRFLTELTIDREYQKAIDYAKKILVKNPYFTRAYAILGDIYVELLDYRNAVNNFREAARLEPENINLNLKYADLLIKIKEFDLVLPIYERLSNKEEFSRNHDFLFWFAKFHFSYGDKHRAEELLRQAIDIQPHGNYYFYYALVLSKNSRYKEAVRNLEIAMEKYPHQLTERQKQDALKAIPAWTKKAENSN